MVAPAPGAANEAAPIRLRDLPAVKQLECDLAREGEHRALEEVRGRARAARAIARGLRRSGARSHRVLLEDGIPVEAILSRLAGAASAVPGHRPDIVPFNVRFNDPSSDGATAGQSEVSVAMAGSFGVAAWNDGQDFITPPAGQGVGYTTDGGATWHDVGLPPLGGTISDWISDPSVAVNEKTGEFWFSSLTQNGPSSGGVAVVRATFPGGVFTWDTPHVAKDLSLRSNLIDKEWVVADSTSGVLYLTYTHFVTSGEDIGFQRSTDGGVTWSTEVHMGVSGRVTSARPVVAGDGTLYLIWREIGTVDADFIRVRRSTDHGVTFGTQHTAATYFDNFGTGAPGFNRNRDVVEPCPAVDRSTGPHRGRMYVVVQESLDYFDDPLSTLGSKSSVENDNFFAGATPFVPGQQLHGTLSSGTPTDLDYFSFSATAGASYIIFCDSIPNPLYTMRIFSGQDTLTRLAFSGDIDATAGGTGLIVWTAPTTGTYYLRLAFVQATGSTAGNYRIETGVAARGSEPGRDQRDVIVRYSDDGGATWSGPRRANDDAALYDDFLPEVGITVEGYPYCAWYDWRDALAHCGGESHVYVTRSLDGGDTWQPNQRVTTASTAWTTAPVNIAPNMGDYIGLYAGGALALGWGDARAGEADVNVWGTTVPVSYDLGCPRDTTVHPNSTLSVPVPVTNHHPLYANTYDYTVTVDRSWPVASPAGSVTVAENGATGTIPVSITIPDTADGTAHACVTVSLAGASRKPCCFAITARGALAAGEPGGTELAIQAVWPNPAARSLAVWLSLPDARPARLELVDVNGRRVASRDVGSLGPGLHVVRFERDLAALPAGVYAVKLTRPDRSITRKVSIVR